METAAPPETESNLVESLTKIIGVLRRQWMWIVAIACTTTIATNLVLVFLPNRYTSEATLLVIQQQVPERYVVATTSTSLADALLAMKEEVLSRTRLLEIIGDFHLYPKQRKSLAPEQVLELMRRNIIIAPLNTNPERQDFNAFKISFTAGSPQLARDVTSRLTSLFIEENLRTREDQATNTTNFLSQQLKTVAARLAEKEQQLRDYKMQHLGELPEEQQGNVAVLQGLQSQLQNTEAALSRAQQQRVYLESQLNDHRRESSRATTILDAGDARHRLTPLQEARAELERLRVVKNNLLTRYTLEHPDVVRAEADIARQQKLVDSLASSERHQQGPDVRKTDITLDADDDPAVMQIRSQLEANRLEIDSLVNDQKRLKAAADDYQKRLDATPVAEQQLSAVLRDYDLLKKEYADLLNKQQQSQLATSLEKQQEGQQFRLVDSPSLPSMPSSPKRLKLSVGGLAGGFVLALAIGFLKEIAYPCFHTQEDLEKHFKVPVVCVPLLFTPGEKRGRSWRSLFEWMAAAVLVVAALGAELLVFRWR